MYVGRLVVAGPGIGGYRVSSRSFPNRKAISRDGTCTVVPTSEAPETDNPYISYNCLRTVGVADHPRNEPRAVLGNGSHVDPVAEKLSLGYPSRDALATALLALDYERDDYNTPRIAAVVGPDTATVGTVRRDVLIVRSVDVPTLVATYEKQDPERFEFSAGTAAAAAQEVYDLDFEHPICAAGVSVTETVETAITNASRRL